MNDADRQLGLLTLLVDPAQGAAAVHAAFDGESYRRGNLIYLDDEDNWFHPVATFKVASQPSQQSSKESSNENHNETDIENSQPKPSLVKEQPIMSASTLVKTAVKKTKQLFGIDRDNQKFFELQQFIASKPEVTARHRAAGQKLESAKSAKKAGSAEFDELQVDFAIREFEHAFLASGQQLARINSAEVELVGICPSGELQRERRQLTVEQQDICRGIASLETQIESSQNEVKRHVETLKLSGLTADETQREQRQLAREQIVLDELKSELAELVTQRDSIDGRKRDLHRRMRQFGLTVSDF